MLQRLVDEQEITNAVQDLETIFRSGAKPVITTIGFPGGRVRETAYWRKDVGVWLAKRPEWASERHWTAYGVVEPLPSRSIPIAVEINPPKRGMSRRLAGFVAVQEDGKRFLCHTGRLGGGTKGINRANFLAWRGGALSTIRNEDDGFSEAIVVACIDSEQFVAQLADFVKLVARFKAGKPAPVRIRGTTEGFNPEFAGKKMLPARDATVAIVNHGVVVNELAALLQVKGIQPARDQLRDLFVETQSQTLVHIEVKTSTDTQSVYTGVGQLALLGTRMPAKARFLVLPRPVPSELESDLFALGIHLATYQWHDQTPVFESLDLIVQAACS